MRMKDCFDITILQEIWFGSVKGGFEIPDFLPLAGEPTESNRPGLKKTSELSNVGGGQIWARVWCRAEALSRDLVVAYTN